MIPLLNTTSEILPDQSVIWIVGDDNSFPSVNLTPTEKAYVIRCQADNPDYILVNSYFKVTIFIKEKSDLPEPDLLEDIRKKAVQINEELKKHKQLSVAITSHKANDGSVEALTEGLILSNYQFKKYTSSKSSETHSNYPETILIEKKNAHFISRLTSLSEAVYFARDRVNEPLSHQSAEIFAAGIADFCKNTGLTVDILTKKRIEALKMGGIIAVNRGSNDPPTLSVIEWKPSKHINSRPVILVGKGVVFDTGGLNLKPTDYIDGMKADMAGGAAVAAVMYFIAKTKLPLHVMAFIPATDNRPGQDAYAPGDVITMYNGKTVEVLNTDAEGRLILADALSYAGKYNPSLVISIATLTGSAANTYGNKAIAVMGNADKEIMNILEEAGNHVFERIAQLPFWKEYGDVIKSDIADLKNIGEKEGGAIIAGKFLENFTGSPFIHLDIAGTAMLKKVDEYRPKGGTGSGVRLLSNFLERLSGSDIKLNN